MPTAAPIRDPTQPLQFQDRSYDFGRGDGVVPRQRVDEQTNQIWTTIGPATLPVLRGRNTAISSG